MRETHDFDDKMERRSGRRKDEQLRYTDTHVLERERGLSIKAAPMSLVLGGTKGKSSLFNILDTPGHVDCIDEVAAALRLSDGVVIVVDCVEGVQINTERIIKHAVLEGLNMVCVINKLDRLPLELKLPPNDACEIFSFQVVVPLTCFLDFKLKHIIEQVNTVIENTLPGRGETRRLSPELGNVAFGSSSSNWIFTLPSFAKMYADWYPGVSIEDFSKRLWGKLSVI